MKCLLLGGGPYEGWFWIEDGQNELHYVEMAYPLHPSKPNHIERHFYRRVTNHVFIHESEL